ncbi:hypothetical protein E2P81_ATG11459 [Venturia nashicola]|nr:hypothetical protein E2P81_ATG11459 [Venturia nashicola]
MVFFAAALSALVAFAAASPVAPRSTFAIGQTLTTTSGVIKGHAAKNRTEVSEYLGIPFAKPPVGDLRWKAPVKYVGDAPIDASKYSADCAAKFQSPDLAVGLSDANVPGIILLTELMQLGHQTSEDCLTLNVWTKPQTGEKGKAVLVWIFGGGFATGNSANPIYNGEFIADNEDVVVVSFNYRLGVFGFPGIPGVDGFEQNPGLLDQRAAIEWVRDNIAAFGGDPKRITIFGESAGGASVDFYSYAWTKDPIVSSMIAESGSVSSFADPQPKDNIGFWDVAAKALKCPTAKENPKSSVDCVRAKNTEEILEAAKTENPLQAVLGHFGPTIDNKVVFSDYTERSKSGNFIQKPFMNGNNDWEAGLFILIGEGAKIKISPKIWDVFNAAVFTCPIQRAANARANNKVLNYRYRYFGDYPNTYLQSNNKGAWHTAEISQIFGTTEAVTAAKNTPSEAKLSTFMQKAWTSFAKDPASLQKAPFNFPQYNAADANAPTLIALGGSANETHKMVAPFQWDVYCDPISSLTSTIPGGIQAAINNVAAGGELGVPGLKTDELPDMKPAPFWTYSGDA